MKPTRQTVAGFETNWRVHDRAHASEVRMNRPRECRPATLGLLFHPALTAAPAVPPPPYFRSPLTRRSQSDATRPTLSPTLTAALSRQRNLPPPPSNHARSVPQADSWPKAQDCLAALRHRPQGQDGEPSGSSSGLVREAIVARIEPALLPPP